MRSTSYQVEKFVEWIEGRHMPYIEDEQEELVAYVVAHHEATWNCHARPIPASRTPKGWEWSAKLD